MPTREEQEALAFLRELAADCDRRVASATTAIRRYSRQPTFTPLDSKNLGDIEFDQQAAKEVGARYKNIIALIEAFELRKGTWQPIETLVDDHIPYVTSGTVVLVWSEREGLNMLYSFAALRSGKYTHWTNLPAPPVNAEAVKGE